MQNGKRLRRVTEPGSQRVREPGNQGARSHGKCCTHLNVTRVTGEERNIINQRFQQGRKKKHSEEGHRMEILTVIRKILIWAIIA